jgi:hypothetical protein
MSLPGVGKRTPSSAHPNPRLSRIALPSENAIHIVDFNLFDDLAYNTVDVSAQSGSTTTGIYLPNEQAIQDICDLGVTDGGCLHG